MRLAGGLEKTVRTHEFVSYCASGSIATVGRTVSTVEASSARRSARAGRAAKAFRTFKYPNEIGPAVHDIQSPRVPTLDEMHDLSSLRGIASMTRRSGSARALMQLVRQNPRLDPNGKFFRSCDTILGLLYKAMHKCELVVRHLTEVS